jgi:UDP-glucose 4-epimerase
VVFGRFNSLSIFMNSLFFIKSLLITGGTGSFGNAALRRFLHTNIKEIRVFSRDEKKQEDMRIELNNLKVKFYIGDVRDYDSINFAMPGRGLCLSCSST